MNLKTFLDSTKRKTSTLEENAFASLGIAVSFLFWKYKFKAYKNPSYGHMQDQYFGNVLSGVEPKNGFRNLFNNYRQATQEDLGTLESLKSEFERLGIMDYMLKNMKLRERNDSYEDAFLNGLLESNCKLQNSKL